MTATTTPQTPRPREIGLCRVSDNRDEGIAPSLDDQIRRVRERAFRELVPLPPALEPPGGIALACRRGSTCGLDRIGGSTKLVRGDVCNSPRLASSVRGMPGCPTQVSGRAHGMAARRAGLHHCDLTSHPGAGVLNRFTWSRVGWLNRLEQVEDVLRA